MGIKITGKKVPEQMAVDNVFVDEITITQTRNRDDNATAVYNVDVKYRLYGVDDEGLRHFQGQTHAITIEDFITSSQGKSPRMNALTAIEAAIADILADDSSIDTVATN